MFVVDCLITNRETVMQPFKAWVIIMETKSVSTIVPILFISRKDAKEYLSKRDIKKGFKIVRVEIREVKRCEKS